MDFTNQQTDTNWLEVVSSELRAWWEVTQRPPARNPDPIVVVPPPLVSTSPYPATAGVGAIDNRVLLLIGGAILLVMLNK